MTPEHRSRTLSGYHPCWLADEKNRPPREAPSPQSLEGDPPQARDTPRALPHPRKPSSLSETLSGGWSECEFDGSLLSGLQWFPDTGVHFPLALVLDSEPKAASDRRASLSQGARAGERANDSLGCKETPEQTGTSSEP